MRPRDAFRRLLRRAGFDIVRYDARSHAEARRVRLFGHYGVNRAPDVGKQTIKGERLDSVFDEHCSSRDVPYLKIDAQGYEMQVLLGAGAALQRIPTIQLELSLTPLYAGSVLLPEMSAWLYAQGYTLVSLEAGHTAPDSGELLQADGIFHRLR